MKRIRIVLADDHPVVLAGVRALIEASPDMAVVGEAGDGRVALDIMRRETPDVAVIDVSMPGMSGLDLAGRIATELVGLKVLVLTAQEDRAYVRQLMKGGAHGYVLKRSAAAELPRAIRAVHAGGIYIDPAIAGLMADPATGAEAAPAASGLSERELEVLRRAAQGWTNRETADALSLSIKTVETYKARAAEKLGLKTRAEIVRYAKAQGWFEHL